MISFRQFLLENRIEFLKKTNKEIDISHDQFAAHHDTDSIVDHFSSHADPSKNKQHTQWILNQYKKKNIRQEDSSRVHDTLSNFDKYKSKLPKKDLNQYQHITDVDKAVEPHIGTVASKGEEERQIKHEGAPLIHKEPELTVHHIKTKEAACYYGKGTKWCTAADKNNMFDRYNKEGNLYTLHHTDGTKHQFHFESGQFVDEQDRMHDLSYLTEKYPKIKNVKEFKNKHASLMGPNELNDPKNFLKIAKEGNTNHISELLKKHNLDHDTKYIIAARGNRDHISELLKNHNLDHTTKYIIANRGTHDHVLELLKNHNLDYITKDTIENRGIR